MKQNEDINCALNGSKGRRTTYYVLTGVAAYPLLVVTHDIHNRLINDHDLGLVCSAHARCRSGLEWPMTAKSVCTGLQTLVGNQWMTVIAIHDVLINVWKGSRNWA